MDTTIDNGLDGLVEITPPESTVPIYFLENQLTEIPEWETPEEMIAHHNQIKENAALKLTKLGLTIDEAKSLAGIN